jgi:hypothetical protein
MVLLLAAITLRSVALSQDLVAARSSLLDALTVGQRAGFALTPIDASQIANDLQAADISLGRSADGLEHDPLLRVARALPLVGTQLDALATMTSAGRDLTSRHHDVRILMAGFIEARDSGQRAARLASLIRFVHSQQASISRLVNGFERADQLVSGLPSTGLIGQVAGTRDLLAARLKDARPAVAAAASTPVITDALGAGGEKRYLMMALDNAEIRPIGGLIAAIATPRFTDGLLHDYAFKDIQSVDRVNQKQYVKPPTALSDHLLGDFTWQVADAGWSPDFATSTAEARRMFQIETGDANLQGSIAFTPEFVDALLKLVGPVPIPSAGITVHAGETYLVSLEQSEVLHRGQGRKQFLADLASAVLDRLFALAPARYPEAWAAIDDAGKHRHLQILLDDRNAQALVTGLGWYTPFTFPSGGDRLSIMEANTAPVSKLDALLELHHQLDVALQSDGGAQEQLVTTFTNLFGPKLSPALERVRLSFGTGNLGSYQRRYLRPDAAITSVNSDDPNVPITDPESLDVESGSLAVGNYQLVTPGAVHLTTAYTIPSVVQAASGHPASGGTYTLRFFKQPGRDRDTLTVRVNVPSGTVPAQWSDGGVRAGSTVTFSVTTAFDQTFTVIYRKQ